MASRIMIIILLTVSLIFTGIVLWDRVDFEMRSTNIHYLMDYQDITLAIKDGPSHWVITDEIQQCGIYDVVIKEVTIKRLLNEEAPIIVGFAGDISKDYQQLFRFDRGTVKDLLAIESEDTDFVILTKDEALLNALKKGISDRYHFKNYHFLAEGIVLKSDEFHNIDDDDYSINALNGRQPIDNYRNRVYSIMLETPMFFDIEEIIRAKEMGFHPVLALSSYDLSTKYLDSFEKTLSIVNRLYDEPLVHASEILIEGRLLGKTVSEETRERIEGYLLNSSRSLGIITTEKVNQPLSRYELILFQDFDNVVPYVVSPLPLDDPSKIDDFSDSLGKKVMNNHTRGFYFRLPQKYVVFYEQGSIKEIINSVTNNAENNGFDISKRIIPSQYKNINSSEVLGISLGVVALVYIYLVAFFKIESESKTLLLLGVLLINLVGFSLFLTEYRIGLINFLLIFLPSFNLLIVCDFIRKRYVGKETKSFFSMLKSIAILMGIVSSAMLLTGLLISALSTSKSNMLYTGAIKVNRTHIGLTMIVFLLTYLRSFGYLRSYEEINDGEVYLLDMRRIPTYSVSVYQWLGVIILYVLLRFFTITVIKEVGMFSIDGALVALNFAVFVPMWIIIGYEAIIVECYLANNKLSAFRFPVLVTVSLMLITYFAKFSTNEPMYVLGGWMLSIIVVIIPLGVVALGIGFLLKRFTDRLSN